MDEKSTKRFVHLWNKLNGYPQGAVDQPNMRYVEPNEVTWNEYDAPQISLSEFKDIFTMIGF